MIKRLNIIKSDTIEETIKKMCLTINELVDKINSLEIQSKIREEECEK